MSQNVKYTSLNFDANTVAPQAAIEAVPSGWYNVAMTDGEIKPTNDGSGQRFAFELTILDGEYKGRKIFDGLNLVNNNPQAVTIAQGQLSAICHATQTIVITDLRQLFNKPFAAKVSLEAARVDPSDGKSYDAQNRFKGAKPIGSTQGAAAGPAASPAQNFGGGAPAPLWAAKPAASPAPAAPAPAIPQTPAPAPAAPAPTQNRLFFVYLGDANNIPKKSEAEIAAALASLPANVQVSLAGPDGGFVAANGWMTPAAAGIKAPAPAPAAPAFVPPAAPPFAPAAPAAPAYAPAPAAATPAGAPVAPPWGRV